MCTALVAACICNHYQHLRWISRCNPAASPSPSDPPSTSPALSPSTPLPYAPSHSPICHHPTAPHIQRVDFQCHPCDVLDQALLELSIATDASVRDAARETNRAGARIQREREREHGEQQQQPLSESEREALRDKAVALQLEKEKAIWREAEAARGVLVEEWRGWVEGRWVGVGDWRCGGVEDGGEGERGEEVMEGDV